MTPLLKRDYNVRIPIYRQGRYLSDGRQAIVAATHRIAREANRAGRRQAAGASAGRCQTLLGPPYGDGFHLLFQPAAAGQKTRV